MKKAALLFSSPPRKRGSRDELDSRLRGNDDKKSNATLLVCALLVLTLAACGKKGPPQPPPGVPNTYPQTYPQQ